jgi:drug/metabolite transporter (DMT)-like permease
MSVEALALVVTAAVLHATWNAFAKSSSDPLVFLFWAMTASVLLFAAPAIVVFDGVDGAGLGALAASSVIHAVYIIALAGAYRAGDFSQVYPLARGGGVAGVAIASPLLFGETLSIGGGVGVAAVIGGALLLGWRRAQLWAVGWASLTAIMIASYSMVDDIGVDHMHPVSYIAALGAGTSVALFPFARRSGRLLAELHANRWRVAGAAAMSMSAYLLVLFAYRMSQTTYVVAAREISIAISVVLGVVVFREPQGLRRFAAALVILAGVVAIASS